MMSKFKKLATLAGIAILSVATLAGCGKKGNAAHAKIDKNTVYREQEINLSLPKNYNVNSVVFSGNTAYIMGYVYDDTTYEMTASVIVADIETGASKSIPLDNQVWVNRLVPMGDGKYVLLYEKSFNDFSDPENPIYDSSYILELFDANGKSVMSRDLSKDLGMDYTNNVVLLPDGQIMLMSYDSLVLLDSKFNKVREKKSEDGTGYDFGNLYKIKDGSYVVIRWGESGEEYIKFNPQTLEFGEKLNDDFLTKNYNYSVMQGNGYDFFLRDSTQVYGYNIGDGTPTPLMNFVNSDIYTSYFNNFDTYSENTFVGAYQDWNNEEYSFHICKYTKVNPEDVKDKEIISLGCLYVNDNVRKMVVDFNRSSDEYRINLVDYSVYNSEDDWMAGDNKFNTDIATGQGPDIIIASNTQKVESFINKGLYEDLGKYLDNDPDLSRDSILPGILEACSKKNKVYQIMPSFRIMTVVGKKSILGDRTGWNMTELMDFSNSLPSGMKLFHDMTRESFLSYLFAAGINDYVNPETAKCSFDSEGFMKALEYLKTLKNNEDYYNELYGKDESFNWSEYEYEVRNGKAALQVENIYTAREYKYILRGYIGEEPVFVGFPCEDRNGSYYESDMSIGLSSRCKNPDAAWQLIRQFLLDDYQTNKVYGMPCTVKAFDAVCEQEKENPYWTNADGTKEYYDDTMWINGVDVPADPLTDSEVEDFKAFVNSVKRLAQGYDDISNIIFEEAAPYFEGQKSVEDVVKIIQSRASIFVNEQQ